jgi:hypothetical protein
MRRLAAVLVLGALASGCVTTKAQTPVERPALDVPPAPPRVIEPAPVPEVVMPEPVGELPPPPIVPSPPSRATRGTTTGREAQKPEPKPEAAAPPPTEPAAIAPAAQTVPPAPLLRTQATADSAAAERQIRDTIQRAQGILNGINYQRLSSDRQKEYQNVKDILTNAEAALKESNLDLGKTLASTAEKLAKELQSR